MSGAFCRQFSIAVWPLAWSPPVSWEQTREESPFLMPKPFRKPLCRWTPTETPGARSRVAIFAVLPFMAALAYSPISSPALRLSVANRASTALSGSVGVSRAMTRTPLALAFSRAGTIALESLGVIRRPFTPDATMVSTPVTCPALSPSNLPAAVDSSTPSSLAAFFAPSLIFTKNGLVSVLVIRPTLTLPDPVLAVPDPDPEPQAVRARAATLVHAAALSKEEDGRDIRDMNDSCGIAGEAAGVEACRPRCHR